MKMLLLSVFLCGVATSSMAQSSPMCGARAGVVQGLENRYSEKPIAAGLDHNGALVEVLTAPDGATWTILVSMPNGMSCVVSTGESWQTRAPTPRGDPS